MHKTICVLALILGSLIFIPWIAPTADSAMPRFNVKRGTSLISAASPISDQLIKFALDVV